MTTVLLIQLADGEPIEYVDVTRYKSDESNNLCIYAGDVLLAMYAAGYWLSAVLQIEED